MLQLLGRAQVLDDLALDCPKLRFVLQLLLYFQQFFLLILLRSFELLLTLDYKQFLRQVESVLLLGLLLVQLSGLVLDSLELIHLLAKRVKGLPLIVRFL